LLFSWACASVILLWWCFVPHLQRNDKLTESANYAWLGAACISAVLGFLQFFNIEGPFTPLVNSAGLGEAFGNLRQRNQYASLCAIGLAVLGTMATSRHWVRAKPWTAVAAALLGAAMAMSGSRTALLELAFLLILAWRWRGARVWTMAVAVVAYALAAHFFPRWADVDSSVFVRLQDSSEMCASRLSLWGNVLQLIAQKPFLGWGWGELDFAHFMTLYANPPFTGLRFCAVLDNAHNLPLHLAVELGVPIALAACYGVFVWIRRKRPWQELDSNRRIAWSILGVVGIHSLLEYPLWYGPFQIAVLMSLWMLRTPKPVAETSNRLRVVLVALAGITMAAAVGFYAWSYWRVSQLYMEPEARAVAYRTNTFEKIKDSLLFQNQVRFAQLAITPLDAENAKEMFALSQTVLHFSPEPLVIIKAIESAKLLGLKEEVLLYSRRFEAAFPLEYAAWSQGR
jgi:hypothetical protein